MEKEIKIKTKDKHIIYGTFNYKNRNSKKLIIFVHGLTSTRNDHIFFNATKYFNKHNISVFRFDLYYWGKNGRQLIDCDFKIHAIDIETVVKFFGKKFNKIYLIGHSLGCPSILFSNIKDINGIIFWDPSYNLGSSMFKKFFKYNNSLKAYIMNAGTQTLISKKLYNQMMDSRSSWSNLAKKILVPFKVICAGNGVLIKGGKVYIKNAKGPKNFIIIKGASHSFDEEGVEDKLFSETLSWIKNFDHVK